jgi:hypothetical protein
MKTIFQNTKFGDFSEIQKKCQTWAFMKMSENFKILWKKKSFEKNYFFFVFGLRIILQNFKKIEKNLQVWELGIFSWKSLKTEKFTSFENLEYFCKKKFFWKWKKNYKCWELGIIFIKSLKLKKITSVENLEIIL